MSDHPTIASAPPAHPRSGIPRANALQPAIEDAPVRDIRRRYRHTIVGADSRRRGRSLEHRLTPSCARSFVVAEWPKGLGGLRPAPRQVGELTGLITPMSIDHPSSVRTMGKNRSRISRAGGRLTGLDFLGFGASWEPAVSDASVAESLIRYLEDRRVLYNPSEVEVAEHYIESVVDIRRRFTEVLAHGGIDQTLRDSLEALRTACRTFLDRLHIDPTANEFEGVRQYRRGGFGGYSTGLTDWVLNQAIGELRGVFGIHVALIVARYGIEVEEDLASILPADPDA